MKFLVLFNIILNVLCVAGKGWNSDDYIENCSDGYFSEWISYVKRFSLAVLMLSGVILYYIPDSRSHARKGCCLIIDSVADGLKTVLCLKESDTAFDKKKAYYVDSFISKESDPHLYKNVDFEYRKHHKDLQDTTLKEERKGVSKRIREKLIHDVNERPTNRHRHHQRHEKSNRHIKDVRDSSGDNQHFLSNSNYDRSETGNQYLNVDGSSESSAMFSTRNCASYLISGNQQMAMLDEIKNDVNISRKIYPVKQKYDEKSNLTNCGYTNKEIAVEKELQKPTRSVAKMVSTAKTVILNHSGLKSTCDVSTDEYVKKPQTNKEYENKDAKIYYERTPRLKEKMNETNAEIKCKDKAAKLKETEKLLKEEGTDENERDSAGAELLYELGDQINKLDLTIRMIRPSSRKEITEKGIKEEYALRAVESVLKDIKEGFQEYDKGVQGQRKERTRTILSEENKLDVKNKKKSREALKNKCLEDENNKLISRNIKKLNCKRVTLSEENDLWKKEWRKERKNELNYFEDNEHEDESISEDDEPIPIFTNRVKPILSRAVGWLFGGCPRANQIRPTAEEN